MVNMGFFLEWNFRKCKSACQSAQELHWPSMVESVEESDEAKVTVHPNELVKKMTCKSLVRLYVASIVFNM